MSDIIEEVYGYIPNDYFWGKPLDFSQIFTHYFGVTPPFSSQDMGYLTDLWARLAPKYLHMAVSHTHSDPDLEMEGKEFFRKFLQIFAATKLKYETICDMYMIQKADGLKDTSWGKSHTKFNDTPQTEDIGQNWELNKYVSTVNSTETESNWAPVMDQIDNIRQKWDDIVDDWCKEFNKLFQIICP